MILERLCKVLDILKRYDPAAQVSVTKMLEVRIKSKKLDPKHLTSTDEREITFYGFGWYEKLEAWQIDFVEE